MSQRIDHLILIVVFGVILADLVSHVAGTTALFRGVNILWTIGLRPTDTGALDKAMKGK